MKQDKLKKRYREMLEFQEEIYPFTPTVRELQDIFNLNSTSAVVHVLEQMRENDMVVVRQTGSYRKYYAI